MSVSTLTLAMLLGAADPAASLPKIPPPAPMLKGASFSCEMHGINGFTFSLAGVIRDFKLGAQQVQTAKVDLQAPPELDLSKTYDAAGTVLGYTETKFINYDKVTSVSITGVLRNTGRSGGTIVIERRVPFGGSINYVGFCQVKLSIPGIN